MIRRPSGRQIGIAALALWAVSLATPVASAAPTSAPQEAAPVSMSLAGQTRFIPGDEDSRLTLRLRTTGLPNPPRPPRRPTPRSTDAADVAPSPYEVVVVALAPPSTRAELLQVLDDAANGAPLTDVIDAVSVPYEDTRVRNGALVVKVPVEIAANVADELMLPLDRVYPLIVTVTKDGAPLTRLQTFVERLPMGRSTMVPDVRGSLDLTVLGQVDGPPTLLPNRATRTDPDTVAELRRVTQVLQDLPTVPVTLALRPEVVEGLNRSREISDRTLLNEMGTALGPRELLAQTYVRTDPSSMVAADLEDDYIAQLRRGEDALAAAFPQAVTVRSSSIIDEPITGDGADLLRNLGVRSVVVLPEAQASLGGDGAAFTDPQLDFELALPSGDALPATVLDVRMAELMSTPAADTKLTAHQIMAELTVWLSEIAAQGGRFDGRTLILTGPDGRLPDGDLLRALVALIDEDPRFALTPLGQSSVTTDVMTIDGVPMSIDPALVASSDQSSLAYALGVTRSEMDSTGSMLPSGDPRPQDWQALSEIAPSLDLDSAGRAAYLDTIVSEAAAVRGSVSGPPRNTFTLGGRSGEITLSLRNDSDVPLTVVVRLSSPKLLFPDGQQTEVLAADSTTNVRVPVEARSNNTTRVTVELLTPSQLAPVTPPVQLTARVTAFTGLGQLATGAAVIILATWWVRHWRANRRKELAKQLEAAPRQHPSSRQRSSGVET